MTSRQVRRAAERAARKQERKAANGFVFSPPDVPIPSPEPSDASEPPPAISSSHSRPTAPTPCSPPAPRLPQAKPNHRSTQLKPHSPAAPCCSPPTMPPPMKSTSADFFKELRPMNTLRIRPRAIYSPITAWRLRSCVRHSKWASTPSAAPSLPTLQRRRSRSATQPHRSPHLPHLRKAAAESALQFARLCRQREKDTAELKQLQQERIKHEKQELETGAKLYTAAKHDRKPFDPAEFGLDCSVENVECYLKGLRAANLLNATLKQERDQVPSRSNAA